MLELLFKIEEAFDLEIPNDDLSRLSTVRPWATYIEERLARRGRAGGAGRSRPGSKAAATAAPSPRRPAPGPAAAKPARRQARPGRLRAKTSIKPPEATTAPAGQGSGERRQDGRRAAPASKAGPRMSPALRAARVGSTRSPGRSGGVVGGATR